MSAVTGWRGFRAFLDMIKIEHSVFALPFALTGMLWGTLRSREGVTGPALGLAWPGWQIFLLILLAMVSCRSAAMAYNRIADRDIDALNPRTRTRAIPSGILSLRTSNLYFFGSCALFFLASGLLNPLALTLSPVALFVTLFYSRTKRFTPLCHFVLGVSLGIAPVAAGVASTGRVDPALLILFGVVTLWTAGFDIIYSLQDETFDRDNQLRSLPQTMGAKKALLVSRVCHILAWLGLSTMGFFVPHTWVLLVGTALVGVLLVYEHSLVKPHDLSRVNLAFFTLNGFVSVGFFVFVVLDLWIQSK